VYLSAADSERYWELGGHGGDIHTTPALLTAAKDAADRAVALDPNLPEIHLAVGYYRYYGLHDYTGALEEFQLAEKGLPNDAGVLRAISLIQRRLGHWDQVVSGMRRVMALDPRNTESASILSYAYYVTRNYSDQIAVENHIVAIEPSNEDLKWDKVIALWGMGNLEAADQLLANHDAPIIDRAIQALYKRRFAEAADLFSKAKDPPIRFLGLAQQRAGNVAASKAAFQQAVQECTQRLSKAGAQDIRYVALSHSLLGQAYAGLGDASRAISEGQKGMETLPAADDGWEGPQREADVARIYAMLGNADEAIPILERWIHVHADTQITPTLLRIDPIWDPIRNDPRFQKLCQQPNK
jgi:serine/threonine-protein kinase